MSALQCLKFDGGSSDFVDHRLHARKMLANFVDFHRASARQIAIVGQHSARARRIALVQQQFDLLLWTHHVRGPYLRGQYCLFRNQHMLVARTFDEQFSVTPLRVRQCAAQAFEPLALGGDIEIGLAQTCALGVSLLELAGQPARQRRDLFAHSGQFGFCLRGIRGFRGRPVRADA